MRMTVMVMPLLVALMLGVQPGEAAVSTFLNEHADDFLNHMKTHFDLSLDYLLTGNAFGDQSVQRPGLSKLLKGESDRHWDLGIGALKKYLEREGRTPAKVPSEADEALHSSQDVVFSNKFTFRGSNSVNTVNKDGPDFSSTYLQQCKRLVTDCRSTAASTNVLLRKSTKQHRTNYDSFDGDMGHYFEEKLEEEVALLRKYSDLYTSLQKMTDSGLAQHIFDRSLLD